MSNKEEIKKARYVSKYAQLRIVLKPAYTSELNGRVITHPGEDVRFENGYYETDKPEVIEALEKRSEFGGIFIRVPDDTDAQLHRTEWSKDLETRQKELEAKEKALAEREAKLDAKESGRTVSNKKEEEEDLEALTRDALEDLAQAEGVENPEDFPNKKTLIEAIKENRENQKENGSAEGQGTPAY